MKTLIPDTEQFINENRPLFRYMKTWGDNLPTLSLKTLIGKAGGPGKTAVICVDMIEGFCRIGPLASPRVKATIDPIVTLLKKAYESGVRHFAIPKDTHTENSAEFQAFPPHCLDQSEETEIIKEIQDLPFFSEIKVIPKNSLSSNIDTDLEAWLTRINPSGIIVMGDCTDLCTYQLAMFIRLLANSRAYPWEVVIPINTVDTYDLPVETAESLGAPPHPGDFFHIVFLYHMHINGIKIVKSLA